MCTWFSTIQINNPNQIEEGQFTELLCEYMNTKGLMLVTEKKSEFSYNFIYSKSKNWITLISSEYDDNDGLVNTENDIQVIAKLMKAKCILTHVNAYDALYIRLFCDATGEEIDQVILAKPDYWRFKDVKMGNPKYWKPFLADNHTWEQLLDALSKDKIFAEDIFYKVVPMFGMDSDARSSYYKNWEKYAESRIVAVHFKKKKY